MKYTQADFDAMPIVDGRKQCPSGDYTAITMFPVACNFGQWCNFGQRCSFWEGCNFGQWCSFWEGCNFENGLAPNQSPTYFIRINNIGSRSDGCMIFNTPERHVRCGCFFGTGAEFLAKVEQTHGDNLYAQQYKLAMQLAEVSFKELILRRRWDERASNTIQH